MQNHEWLCFLSKAWTPRARCLHADDHDACGDAGVPLGGGPSLSVCPNVEDLARYLIDEDWLPEPAGGASRIEPDTEDAGVCLR